MEKQIYKLSYGFDNAEQYLKLTKEEANFMRWLCDYCDLFSDYDATLLTLGEEIRYIERE